MQKNSTNMYQSNGQRPTYPQNIPYQQSQSHQSPNSFSQQQCGPRFQTPPRQFTPPRPFYQPSRPNHNSTQHQYQSPAHPQQFYHPSNPNFDQTPKPPHQTPLQHFETSPKPPYQLPIQNFKTPPNTQYPPPSVGPDFNQMSIPPFVGPDFNQMSIPPYRIPGPTYEPPIQNYNQPPPPIQNYNNHPPIPNYNHPPVQNYNPPVTPPYQPVNQSCHQPMRSPYQSPSPGYGSILNSSYGPQVQNPELLNKPYQLSANQCVGQQQSSFNSPRPEFNQRPSFRSPGQQRFPFNNPNPRYQQPQQDNNRFQFHPRQPYQNYRSRAPSTNFINQPKVNNVPKKDKLQISCEMGDCDFVGHASAVKEHQNMHHRLGLHKKVLYSNNSDAIKNWIEERKKKWPTKETIKIKSEVEEEKNKRGERIVDEDFNRFNKKNKFNQSGPKQFNNRKRPRYNGEFIEPVEEPMNGKLKRFPGITVIKEEEISEEPSNALKMLEEYNESNDSQSDNEPPEETAIVKKLAVPDNKNVKEPIQEPCSPSEIRAIPVEQNKDILSTAVMEDNSGSVDKEVKNENDPKINEEFEKTNIEHGQKRKRTPKKEFKQIKKMPPLRTPRTEIVERKGALLEALMGDLMRSERNTITQCICYIRNNMNRFCKIQAA